jgi:outer membrane protein W
MILKLFKVGILLMICFLGSNAFAQRDLIITQAGEEIRCKIIDETPTRFIYKYIGKNNKVLMNEIFKNLVVSFKYNQYASHLTKNGEFRDSGNTNTSLNSDPTRIDTRKSSDSNQKESKKSKKESKEKENSSPEPFKEPKEEIVTKEDSNEKSNIKAKGQVQNSNDSSTEETILEKSQGKELASNNTIPQKKNERPSQGIEKSPASVQKNTAGKNEEIERVPESQKLGSSQPTKEKASVVSEESDNVKVEKSPVKNSKLKEKVEVESENNTEKEVENDEKSPLEDEKSISDFDNYLKFRVGFRGGYGNIMNNPFGTDAFGLYQAKMLRGWTFGSDFSYFFTDNIGLGVFYTNYQTTNSAKNISAVNQASGAVIENAIISNKVSHKYVGPILYYRKHIDYKTMVVLGVSGGKYFISDKAIENGLEFKNTSNTYGGAATLGLDFLIGSDATGRDVIFSIEGGYNYGKLNHMNYGAGKVSLANPIDISRLDLTIGLRFTRFPRYLRLSN